jgi:hypothetical protein
MWLTWLVIDTCQPIRIVVLSYCFKCPVWIETVALHSSVCIADSTSTMRLHSLLLKCKTGRVNHWSIQQWGLQSSHQKAKLVKSMKYLTYLVSIITCIPWLLAPADPNLWVQGCTCVFFCFSTAFYSVHSTSEYWVFEVVFRRGLSIHSAPLNKVLYPLHVS